MEMNEASPAFYFYLSYTVSMFKLFHIFFVNFLLTLNGFKSNSVSNSVIFLQVWL